MITAIRNGYAGEDFVIGDLKQRNFITFRPDLPMTAFDVVAYKDGVFRKIQIKSGRFRNGKMVVDLRKPSAKQRQYTETDYDILAVVDLDSRRIAYVPYRSQSKLTFREVMPDKLTGYQNDHLPLIFSEHESFPDI